MTRRRKTILHVNQAVIAKNRKEGTNLPPLIVRDYRGSKPAHEAEILGPSKLVYRPHDPLDCGARLWLETRSPVMVDGVLA
jgi:hypothetical protein